MRNHLAILFLLTIVVGGCARFSESLPVDYRNHLNTEVSDTKSAQAHFAEALILLKSGETAKAEQAIHQTLICDNTYGPAHNALGKIYFDRGKFYMAAWEFEDANRYMPGRSEPLNNLGLVYEQVGLLDKAVKYFSQANAIDDGHPQYLGNFLRASIRRGDRAEDLIPMLERLVLVDDRKQWREWAGQQLALAKGRLPKASFVSFSEQPTMEAEPSSTYFNDPVEGEFLDSGLEKDSEVLGETNR